MVPHDTIAGHHDATKSHAEAASGGEDQDSEHPQFHHDAEATEAGSHTFGGDGVAPEESTFAPMTSDPHPSSITEGSSSPTTSTESSGIFGGFLESIFGGEEVAKENHVTQGPPAGEEALAEAKDPGSNTEATVIDRVGQDEEPDFQLTNSSSGPTTRPTSRRYTETRLQTESTSPKATEAPAGLWPMLRVSSCNIYGRVYQVGSKISVLSGPCKECKCTSGGVECYRIKCF